MGLLDAFAPKDSILGGLLNDPNASLALAATLMQGNRAQGTLATLGQGLLSAATVHQATTKQERENRQQEISQLAATYKILKDQDQSERTNAAITGQPYRANPLMAQYEQRLSQLMGAPQLYGQPSPNASMVPPMSAMPNRSQISGPPSQDIGPNKNGFTSSQLSQGRASAGLDPNPAGGTEFSPPAVNSPGQLDFASANGSVASGTPPGAPQQQRATPNSIPEMLQGAGIPPAMAQAWAQTPEGQRALFKHLGDVYGPRVVNNVLMQMQPNGQTRFLGGAVGPDVAPVTAGPNGALSVQPVQGATDYFANRAAANTRATEGAKAEFDMVNVPTGNGQQRYMTRAQAIGQTGQQQGPQSSSPDSYVVPREVQAQRDQQRMQILYAERDRLKRTGQTDPNLEREIQYAEQGRSFGGPASSGPGFVAGQTTAGKTAAETNPKLQLDFLAKGYEDATKAAESLYYTDVARTAVNGAASTGIFAKPALLAARVGSAFGVTDQRAASDPEVFMAMAAKNVMSTIKQLGAGSGISDSDREYAAKAAGGDLRLNRDSINRLLDIQERASRRLIELHNGRADQAEQSGVPNVFSYRVDSPATARTPVAGGGSLQKNMTALMKAKQAIQQGKPKDAVIQRMIEQGFDPSGL